VRVSKSQSSVKPMVIGASTDVCRELASSRVVPSLFEESWWERISIACQINGLYDSTGISRDLELFGGWAVGDLGQFVVAFVLDALSLALLLDRNRLLFANLSKSVGSLSLEDLNVPSVYATVREAPLG
jgi:hypothetical protein